MESIEAKAFKSSCFSPEIATKPANSQALGAGEDYLLISPAGVGDDFSVDEFFDLQGLSEEEGEEEEEKSSSESSSSSLSSQDQIDEGSSVSGAGLSSFLSAADGLAIPVDDMKELELWSHLMDGTLFDEVAAWPTRNTYIKTGPNVDRRVRPEPETKPATVDATRFPPPTPVKPTGLNVDKRVRPEPETKPATVDATHFPPPTLVKPRSKRQKISTGAWLASWLLQTGDSSFSSEPGFESPTAAVQVTTTCPTKSKKPGVRKPRRKPAAAVDDGSLAAPVQQRKCTHCQVQKTPQWRTGPFGPKTLCNACGVRFKSGRLFPEYRPACSPTFTSEIHSNSHRKVIEMRKKKMAEPGAADFLPTVLSC